MAGFGGAVKLTGESEYKRALMQITQNLKEVTAQMRTVSSAFDKNDKSTAAVSAKTEAYNRQLEQQKQKLNVLKAEYAEMVRQYNENIQKHDALVKQYETEKAKLEQIGRELGTSSDEYKAQLHVVEDYAKAVKDSTSAMESNNKQLSDQRIKMSNAETEINKTSRAIEELTESTEDAGEKTEVADSKFKQWFATMAQGAKSSINGIINAGFKAISKGVSSAISTLISLGKQAVASYAAYEQMVGGVETIFKDSADIVKKYASEAWKTSGVSANQYMEQVTSFSATLIKGLKNDTDKAAYYADMAIKDMADNVNKMGTSMESVQNAYQGFAKDNYTMLDNLKLGYGGNATEMARLINETGVLGDKVKVTAQTVKDVPFDKIVEAIHIVQKEIGITGTTVDEAKRTISGSTLAMKAAWANLLTGIVDDNADFMGLVDNFSNALLASMDNLLPMIQMALKGIPNLLAGLGVILLPKAAEIGMEIITGMGEALVENLPRLTDAMVMAVMTMTSTASDLLPKLIDIGTKVITSFLKGIAKTVVKINGSAGSIIKTLADALVKNLPMLIFIGLDTILTLINSFTDALPELIDYVPQIIIAIVQTLIDNLPMIASMGVKIISTLADGLLSNMNKGISAILKLLEDMLGTLLSPKNITKITDAGDRLFKNILTGFTRSFGQIRQKAVEIITKIKEGLSKAPQELSADGRKMVQGIWNGINNAKSWILSKIRGFGQSIVAGVKNIFGIHSPSTVMRDEVGKNLALGLGEGFTDEMRAVSADMSNAIPTDFNINGSVGASAGASADMVSAFKQALSEMKIELDDEVAGKFVEKTVARAVFA